MAEEVYTKLREFMDKLPSGFPETPTGVEIKLLKKMFTPEQAELVLKLKSKLESVWQIADRSGLDRKDLADKLENLAQNGLIYRVRDNGEPLYQAYQFLPGVYEFQINRLDREFCELFEEYLPYLKLSLASIKTHSLRIVPIESSLESSTKVAPYNQIRKMVEKEDIMAVMQCICRKEQGLLGNECTSPQEVCLTFGKTAQFYNENNIARMVTKDEVFKILDLAEENGLVLRPSNTQILEFICCCCSCCCPGLRGIKPLDNPSEYVWSYYRSFVDNELCTGCGDCLEICPMDAIKDEEGISKVIEERCIGCGLCVNKCPVQAIYMKQKEIL